MKTPWSSSGKKIPQQLIRYQTPDTSSPDRTDHVWFPLTDGLYKCCLCGCVTTAPPPYPTPSDWVPQHHQLPLTDAERELYPLPLTGKRTTS